MEKKMYTISKQFNFSASHVLNGLPDTHPCSRLHGHNYVIIVDLQGEELNEPGFVIDYRVLEPIKYYIDNTMDHRHLNDVLGEINPTAENIAAFLYYHIAEEMGHIFTSKNCWLKAVTVKETDKTAARYEHLYN